MFPWTPLTAIKVLAVALRTAAAADSVDQVAKGHRLALEICSACHVAAPDQGAPPILSNPPPSLQTIANRPETRPCGRILERWRFWDSRGESGMIHQDSDRIGGRSQCRQRWMMTIGSTRLRCSAPACLGAAGKPRTTAASSRRFISSPSRTFAGARCRSASVIGTACGSASIA